MSSIRYDPAAYSACILTALLTPPCPVFLAAQSTSSVQLRRLAAHLPHSSQRIEGTAQQEWNKALDEWTKFALGTGRSSGDWDEHIDAFSEQHRERSSAALECIQYLRGDGQTDQQWVLYSPGRNAWPTEIINKRLSTPHQMATQHLITREQQYLYFIGQKNKVPRSHQHLCSLQHSSTKVTVHQDAGVLASIPESIDLSEQDLAELGRREQQGLSEPVFFILRGFRGRYIKFTAAEWQIVESVFYQNISATKLLEIFRTPSLKDLSLLQRLLQAGIIHLGCQEGAVGACEMTLQCSLQSYYTPTMDVPWRGQA